MELCCFVSNNTAQNAKQAASIPVCILPYKLCYVIGKDLVARI